MEIRWYGHTAFELKNKSFNILIDPYDEKVGLGKPLWKGNVITLCNRTYKESLISYVKNEPRIIDRPGEYEISDFFIYGMRTLTKSSEEKEAKENNIFKFEYENQHVLHLSHLGEKLTEAQLEQIGKVDVLLLALGSEKTLNVKESKELIEEIDPRVIIPIDTTLKSGDLTASPMISEFVKAMGKQMPIPADFFQTEKYAYNPEGMDIVLLQRSALQ